jgi:hypothetical protein
MTGLKNIKRNDQMKQTVVDWLEDNLIGNPFSAEDFAHNVKIFKKAKEMQKEKMIEFANSFYDECGMQYGGLEKSAEEYYNETYK